MNLEKLLTAQEVAEILRVKISTIYGWVHHKKLIPSKGVGRLCFKRQTIIDFIENGTR